MKDTLPVIFPLIGANLLAAFFAKGGVDWLE
jgi:hypothetical protein